MSDSSAEQPQSASELFVAIEQGHVARVSELMFPMHFTLLNISDDPESESLDTLTAEVEDFAAIVAFTSDDHAGEFAGSMPELFEGDEDVPAFIVDGETLLRHVPEGAGVLLNPETDDCFTISPDLVNAVIEHSNDGA